MSNVVPRIEALLLEGSPDAICGASAVYLTIENNILPPLERVRDIVDHAVCNSLPKIEEIERKTKVSKLSDQIASGYISVQGLKAFKALNMKRELSSDDRQSEIVTNLENLKYKLDHPKSGRDVNLYGSLRQILENLNPLKLTWRDPVANMVLSDDLDIIKNLGPRQNEVFLEPRENMKSAVPKSVIAKCNEFVGSFNNSITSQATRNIFHNKTWKESDRKLLEITERILNTLGEIWCNPAFESSVSRSEQSEGTYISDIIMPLLRSSLGNLLNGSICLSTAERQSIASKARRNAGVDKERMGKKPDIMGLLKYDRKIAEFMFAECSRIICCDSKKDDDDDVKLWRETLDGMSFLDSLCRPTSNQFGVVGIQVAGTTIRLNVLVKDLGGIPRYFHLDHAEIPLSPHLLHTKALIRLLLTLRNILIVNKSLLMEALEKADSHPPRNAPPSPAVSSPTREEQARTRKVSDINPPLCEQRLNKKKSGNLQNKS